MSNTATLEEIAELRKLCTDYDLDGRQILDGYLNSELTHIYNGIGPDRFPAELRELLNSLHPTLLPVALIHDVEYHEGGTKEQFTASNGRFYTNGKTAAFAAYSWYDPRRYLVWNKARQFANLCELFGYIGWTKAEKNESNHG